MSKVSAEPAVCASPATVVIEAYSPGIHGGLYGSLDESHYVCERHVDIAMKRIGEAGMTPFRAQRPVLGRVCGNVFDYTNIGGTKALLTLRSIPAEWPTTDETTAEPADPESVWTEPAAEPLPHRVPDFDLGPVDDAAEVTP